MFKKIIEFFKNLFRTGTETESPEEEKNTSKRKRYICKDGRVLYPVNCRKCGKRTTTSDKETAARNLYVCGKCVPRKKKTNLKK